MSQALHVRQLASRPCLLFKNVQLAVISELLFGKLRKFPRKEPLRPSVEIITSYKCGDDISVFPTIKILFTLVINYILYQNKFFSIWFCHGAMRRTGGQSGTLCVSLPHTVALINPFKNILRYSTSKFTRMCA